MKKLIFYLFIGTLLSSCMHNKIRYIQDKNETFDQVNEYENYPPDYKIQVDDILYIKIQSTNEDINRFFQLSNNQGNNVSSTSQSGGNMYYLNGFNVNDSGFVQIPVLGDIQVIDLSIKEAETLIQKRTDEHLNNAIATVRLVSFHITFLGETNKQGKLVIMQDHINILDAIAVAGGISDYGNRTNVLIVRQTKNGTKTFRVDLTKRNLLSSEKFYMQPNDIVVVEPLIRKSFQLSVRDYTLLLSTITSTATVILLLLNIL